MANQGAYGALRNLLSVFLWVLFNSTAHAEARAPVDAWKGTGLDFDFIRQNVTSQSCRQFEQDFLACVDAIQAMLDHNAKRLRLVQYDGRDFGVGSAVVRRFGSLAVIEKHEHTNAGPSDVLEEIKARRQRNLAWLTVYRDRQGEAAEFDQLIEWLLSQVVEPDHAEAYAAAGINGYISVEDAHATIFSAMAGPGAVPSGSGSISANKNGMSYTGIGVAIQRAADAILITSILNESPAVGAGLRARDVILAIDGQPVDGKPVPEVVASLRGPAGTEVKLTVQRRSKVRETHLRRAAVELKNVSSRVLEDRGQRWGYLRIRSFATGNACFEVRRELSELVDQGVDGIVLDVRDNAGGQIDQAVCVADQFLERGRVVVEMRSLNDRQRKHRYKTRYPVTTPVPLVSLVNAGTGSASEVLVAALKDHGRGLVVGERTFGKGTMQKIRPWKGSRSVLQFHTVARMFSPLGHSVQLVGISPDVLVFDEPNASPDARITLREKDLFPMALPAEPTRTVTSADTNIAQLRVCVRAHGIAEQRWEQEQAGNGLRDYPVYVAEDTLTCVMNSSPDVLSRR